MANIAVPLSCNFIGEFLSLYSIYTTNIFIGIIGGIGIILSAGYALLLLNRVTFGSMSPYISENRDLNRRTRPIKTRSVSPTEGTSRPMHTKGGPADPSQGSTTSFLTATT